MNARQRRNAKNNESDDFEKENREKEVRHTTIKSLTRTHTHTTRNIHLPNRIGIIKIFWIYFFFFLIVSLDAFNTKGNRNWLLKPVCTFPFDWIQMEKFRKFMHILHLNDFNYNYILFNCSVQCCSIEHEWKEKKKIKNKLLTK